MTFFFACDKGNHLSKDTPMTVKIATFDSGFGGFFTAKAIEKSAYNILKTHDTKISVGHFGDSKNAPYGEKTPAQIATLTTDGVMGALKNGADIVFIACNTASTQYETVQQNIAKHYPTRKSDVISIIDSSVQAVKTQIDKKLQQADVIHFAILATPATIKSQTYLKALAKIYNGTLQADDLTIITQERWFKTAGQTIDTLTGKAKITLGNGKIIHLYQLAPANWVELIEKEGSLADKNTIINRDLGLLQSVLGADTKLDGVGEFCTHFPVFDTIIHATLQNANMITKDTFFIKQAPLMAQIFEQKMRDKLQNYKRPAPLDDDSDLLKTLIRQSAATITISGDNVDATKRLARTIFPNDLAPVVTKATDILPQTTQQSQ